MIYRVSLDRDHEDAMPPEEKRGLSSKQIEHLTAWVNDGAPWPKKKSKLSRGGENHYTRLMQTLTTEEKTAMEQLKKDRIFVEPLVWKEGGLRVILNHVPELTTSHLQALQQLAEHIYWLDCTSMRLSPELIDIIASLHQLTILHLEKTSLDNNGLSKLKKLPLQYLNVHSTAINDAGIGLLNEMKTLEKLYVWNSKVTNAGADQLKRSLPKCQIIGL